MPLTPPQRDRGAISVEDKVLALSQRTQAEFKRAEHERGEHARRLEALEQLCHHHLGGLVEQLGQAREEAVTEVEKASQRLCERTERDVRLVSDALEEHRDAVKALQLQTADALSALTKRAERSQETLEHLEAWRRETDKQLAACVDRGSSKASKELAGDLAERFEEQLQAAVGKERMQAHERLRSSCAELTSHLNDLRQELLEQRAAMKVALERTGVEAAVRLRLTALEEAQQRAEEAVREVPEKWRQETAARQSSLEGQLNELSAAISSRFQGKLTVLQHALEERVAEARKEADKGLTALQARVRSTEGALESSEAYLAGQAQRWRADSDELRAGLRAALQGEGLPEGFQQEADRILDLAREEARTVHLEIMSVDTRVAAIEERLAEDPGRRRYDALLRKAGG